MAGKLSQIARPFPQQFPKKLEGKEIPDSSFSKLREALSWANDMVRPTGFAAGTEGPTVADIAFLSTYSTIKAVGKTDISEYKGNGGGD